MILKIPQKYLRTITVIMIFFIIFYLFVIYQNANGYDDNLQIRPDVSFFIRFIYDSYYYFFVNY